MSVPTWCRIDSPAHRRIRMHPCMHQRSARRQRRSFAVPADRAAARRGRIGRRISSESTRTPVPIRRVADLPLQLRGTALQTLGSAFPFRRSERLLLIRAFCESPASPMRAAVRHVAAAQRDRALCGDGDALAAAVEQPPEQCERHGAGGEQERQHEAELRSAGVQRDACAG